MASDVVEAVERIPLRSDMLYDVVRIVASSPDLDPVLDGVVGVLTRATRCHGCFVYLCCGEELRLRGASQQYAHLVGRVAFSVDEGLAGWVARRNTPAFIRENAVEDPRTNLVAELDEEDFQSLIAVPIPSRAGQVLGVIVLNTSAPREFDDGVLNLLMHAAPLLGGAIENAELYEQARRRVEALTTLTAVGQRIVGVDTRDELFRVTVEGVRELLACDDARVYLVRPDDGRLLLAGASPEADRPARQQAVVAGVFLGIFGRGDAPGPVECDALDLEPGTRSLVAAPISAGADHLGVVLASSRDPLNDDAEELLRSLANNVAVTLKKAELIEHLTEDNVVHDLFAVLEDGRETDIEELARKARFALDRFHVFVHATPCDGSASWPEAAQHVEARLRRLAPGAICLTGNELLRAVLPLMGNDPERQQTLDDGLRELATNTGVAIGRSEPRRAITDAPTSLREAADAARVARALGNAGTTMAYHELGAYRYLVRVADISPADPYLEAIAAIANYDHRRGSRLIETLEQLLANRRNVTQTARALMVHPNTLRQRLDRIEQLTGIDVASADLLALELAIKLSRLTPTPAP